MENAMDNAAAIREARRIASEGGRELAVVAHVCGTSADPQGLESQRAKLVDAGAILASSNAQAANLSASLVSQDHPPVDELASSRPSSVVIATNVAEGER